MKSLQISRGFMMGFFDCTVLICVYNKSNFLNRCLNSVISQTLLPKKIVIVDDCSTDNSREIVDYFYNKHPNLFIVINNNLNLGLSKSRNIGLQYADAEYVAFLDADDFWSNDKLEVQKSILDAGADFVYNSYRWVRCNNIDRDRFCLSPSLNGLDVTEKLLEGNLISGSASSVICKFENLSKVGYADNNLKLISNDFGEDWDMWLRLSTISNFQFSDSILTYLDDSGAYSNGPLNVDVQISWFKSHFYIRSKHLKIFFDAAVKYQKREFETLLVNLNKGEYENLLQWMSSINSEFCNAILE